MTDLTIHEIPDDAFDAFAAHASRRGQSVETAVLELIQSAASEERLLQQLERAALAAEAANPDTASPPRSRRRYQSVHPTPMSRR